jgi:DnaJ family protein B protein 8
MQSQSQYRSSYYAVLGVHPRASAAEIRAAYHRLAMVSKVWVLLSREIETEIDVYLLDRGTNWSSVCSCHAQRWHPDKITNGRVDPARSEEATVRFQQIHEAYKGTLASSSLLASTCCFFETNFCMLLRSTCVC